jgi:hypothetical protein
LRRLHRAFAQHRKFLEHEFELGVGLQKFKHIVHRALAVTTIVIKEFDQCDVALRVAKRDLARRSEDRGTVFLDSRAMLFGVGDGLTFLKLRHHVLQQFGMTQQIFFDDLLDLAALIDSK